LEILFSFSQGVLEFAEANILKRKYVFKGLPELYQFLFALTLMPKQKTRELLRALLEFFAFQGFWF
jgi:hypothetical protein